MSDKYILGISGFYHDSAAAILKNGEIVAAAQEERFTRVKHDPRFPTNAINYCLAEAFIEAEELDAIVFYDNPLLTLDRVIKNCAVVRESYPMFEAAFNSILGTKLWIEKFVKREIGTLGKAGNILFAAHHMSHAASCFYPSPFDSAAIITIDGVGEWSTTTICHGNETGISVLKEINYPHSIGLLYSAFTYYCGFKINSGEYKLMGLAPYGEPRYVNDIYDHLIDVKNDGSYRLNTEYFGFLQGEAATNDKFHSLFGGMPRQAESKIQKKQMDLAASLQVVTEEVVLKMARHARDITSSPNLCLAGGVALNCVANGKIVREKIFENIWIQPAAGDAGGALGAAYLGSHLHLREPRSSLNGRADRQYGSYLGPSYSNEEIKAFLNRNNYQYKKLSDEKERNREIAECLADGKVIGFFSGRMEFGPRSLGARSIIGDARSASMQSKMNLKIKYRESFRPFAPAVLNEDVKCYFDLDVDSSYMLVVAPVKKELQIPVARDTTSEDMITVINQLRSTIPAVTHVDYSARIQTVHKETNKPFHDLLSAFKELTGSSVLVNTSFNVRGEPIVCTPSDAYKCFMRTEIDVLVLEEFILYKEDQDIVKDDFIWKEQFKLD